MFAAKAPEVKCEIHTTVNNGVYRWCMLFQAIAVIFIYLFI